MNKHRIMCIILNKYPDLPDNEIDKIYNMLELMEDITDVPMESLIKNGKLVGTFYLFYDDLQPDFNMIPLYKRKFKDHNELKEYIDKYLIPEFGGNRDV
ncbi:MAG: hypothetical protein QXW35_03420 [Candidatus Aenigmatarchaeota archaeon]